VPSVRAGRSRGREIALALVTLALVAGASADFLVAQTLKLEPSPLERPRVEAVFSPVCRCETKDTATLAFTVSEPLQVDAEIIDAEERPVRSLARAQAWEPGRRTLQWDGRDDRGRLVPDGPYRLRVRLAGSRPREIVVPTPVRVDTEAPVAELLSVEPRTITPAPPCRRERERVEVRYRASEPARALLLVDGRSATRRSMAPAGPVSIRWGGRARGRPLPPGDHAVSVQLRDRAGNLGPPSRRIEIRVRRAAGRPRDAAEARRNR
jgi:hypothetical protein